MFALCLVTKSTIELFYQTAIVIIIPYRVVHKTRFPADKNRRGVMDSGAEVVWRAEGFDRGRFGRFFWNRDLTTRVIITFLEVLVFMSLTPFNFGNYAS